MFWESERLLYRPVSITDIDALFRIYGDVRTHEFNPEGVHQNSDQSRNALIQRTLDRERYGFDDWAVAERSNPGEIIGFGGLFVSQLKDRQVNTLGYRFAPESWGKGYATELACRALQYGFDELKLPEIVAALHENNIASRRVLEKAGLILTHEVEDSEATPTTLIFALTLEQWNWRKARFKG